MTPYEVRCPRCDVTFPIETKKCLHCGGRTVRPDQLAMIEQIDGSQEPVFEYLPDQASESPEQMEAELEAPEESTSVGRSLLRSLGGFVWIIVLIGFTLAKNCGGE